MDPGPSSCAATFPTSVRERACDRLRVTIASLSAERERTRKVGEDGEDGEDGTGYTDPGAANATNTQLTGKARRKRALRLRRLRCAEVDTALQEARDGRDEGIRGGEHGRVSGEAPDLSQSTFFPPSDVPVTVVTEPFPLPHDLLTELRTRAPVPRAPVPRGPSWVGGGRVVRTRGE